MLKRKLLQLEKIERELIDEKQKKYVGSIIIRKLEKTDYDKGFLELLEQLTTVIKGTQEDFSNACEKMKNKIILVVLLKNTKTIIGTGSIFIEPKFIHGYKNVGHLEDIVIHKKYRNLGLGKLLVENLTSIGKIMNCYKIILNCSKENTIFYEKNGFNNKNVEMSLYFE